MTRAHSRSRAKTSWPSSRPPAGEPGSEYTWGPRPALDGLRAVAVYLVVLFHGGVAAFGGGFIGVDLFFALSGFLVTNMMLGDVAAHGRLRLLRFYARRFRRLLPAAAIAVVGIAAASVLLLDAGGASEPGW